MTSFVTRLSFLTVVCWSIGTSQHFVRITDPNNPIVTTRSVGNYPGTSWVDYDNDGDLDLFVNPNLLFQNDGVGQFTFVQASIIGSVQQTGGPSSNSWADYDNDGDIDVLFGSIRTTLYTNLGPSGNFLFTETSKDRIGDPQSNRGWSGCWGDFDNDGFVDFIVVHAIGFGGDWTKNHFYRNVGDGRFQRITEGDVVKDFAPYTVATWSDYDLDGDLDLFIGSGPALGSAAKDYLFKNMLKETGTATLTRITEGIIATDLVDGQVWNWIDYDNDGDLDAYLTNYSASNNNLYRNDNGIYVKQTSAQVGSIVSISSSLANIWGDVDNDGDLDCYVTRDGANKSLFFNNNGNGTFTQIDSSAITQIASAHIGASFGDYDNDGDLDLSVVSQNQPAELYRNTVSNGNGWLQVKVIGTVSNVSAIGAKVKVKALINGTSYWQIREVQAQNSFNGHNMQRVHVGLRNATNVDSLIVEWPSGQKKVMVNVIPNHIITITEEIPNGFLRPNFIADTVTEQIPFTAHFRDISMIHPSTPVVSWKWDLNGDGITDATEKEPSWTYTTMDTVAVSLIVSTSEKTDTITRLHYIKPMKPTPILAFNEASHNFGIIDLQTPFRDTTVYVRNAGKGPDTLTVSLKYGTIIFNTVKPDSALSVFPNHIVVNSNDSAAITFRVFPGRIQSPSTTVTYSPRLVLDARNNAGQTHFEKGFTFKLQGAMSTGEYADHPDQYALMQNYPNPFNPGTVIRYQIPVRGEVRLKLFDALGRERGVLLDQVQEPGSYSIPLNSLDFQLSSGLYFYHLTSGSFQDVKKMIILK